MSRELDCPDVIVRKVHDLYESLGKSGKPKIGEEWTCLAAFVVEQDDDFDLASLATGTKCIGGNSMVFDGSVVHDSHAEVLARRNFLRYLYDQLSAADDGSSIFVKSDEEFVLKSGVKFHFYASQVPCGDASIIPMDSQQARQKRKSADLDVSPTKKFKPDVFRTGAKPVESDPRQDPKGDGIDYHIRGAVRLKPGRGDPTKSLSCSDKIAKWLYCGVQGALLSTLIRDPLQLSSIIIGGSGPFDENVLKTALVKRSGLKTSPTILRSHVVFKHSPDASGTVRPCPASINWAKVKDRKLEISVEGRRLGVTKKNPGKSHLLTTKYALFRSFLEVSANPLYNEMAYREAKELAVRYRGERENFVSAMGSWSEDKSAYEHFHVMLTRTYSHPTPS